MFIKVKAKGTVGQKEYNALVAVQHISAILEASFGCQIMLRDRDMLQCKDTFAEVEKKLKHSMGGTGHTLMV